MEDEMERMIREMERKVKEMQENSASSLNAMEDLRRKTEGRSDEELGRMYERGELGDIQGITENMMRPTEDMMKMVQEMMGSAMGSIQADIGNVLNDMDADTRKLAEDAMQSPNNISFDAEKAMNASPEEMQKMIRDLQRQMNGQ